jgi:hypothetical protein
VTSPAPRPRTRAYHAVMWWPVSEEEIGLTMFASQISRATSLVRCAVTGAPISGRIGSRKSEATDRSGRDGITRSRVPAGLNCQYALQQPDWFRPPRSSPAGPAHLYLFFPGGGAPRCFPSRHCRCAHHPDHRTTHPAAACRSSVDCQPPHVWKLASSVPV